MNTLVAVICGGVALGVYCYIIVETINRILYLNGDDEES